MRSVLAPFLALCLLLPAAVPSRATEAPPAAARHFANPIVPARGIGGSADPSVVWHDGYYYYCRSLDDRSIGVARAVRLQDIGRAPMTTIWTAPAGTAYSQQVWAPELQFIGGRWYVYFAASDGDNAHHRMFVLESQGADPQAGYAFKGKIAAATDRWAIDGLSFERDGKLYFVWSGWRGAADGFPQVTYIAPLANPWTIEGERHEIAAPSLPWEQSGAPLMEGHAVLQRGGRLFVVYSTSASWSDDYKLGLLEYTGGDILAAASWKKNPTPVFSKLVHGGAEGPGHNAFVKSPDGSEDWIVYHAIDTAGGGWAQRSVRAQRFGWGADGLPSFGLPVASGVAVAEPAGTASALRIARRAATSRPDADPQLARGNGAVGPQALAVVKAGSTAMLKTVSTAPPRLPARKRSAVHAAA